MNVMRPDYPYAKELKSVSLHSGFSSLERTGMPAGVKVYLDAGDDEKDFRDRMVRSTRALKAEGRDVTLNVFKYDARRITHRWAAWEESLERWIGFHQAAHGGAPGDIRTPKDIRDVSEAALRDVPLKEEKKKKK